MRRLAKNGIELALTSLHLTARARRQRNADLLVLAYHNIIPEGESCVGDASLHLPQTTFAQQLDLLQATHDVIPISELSQEGRGKPRAVITFDDAYAGALGAGIEELKKRGLPATVFVAPAFVGGAAFWWDRLAQPNARVDAMLRAEALDKLAGKTSDIIAWAEEVRRPLLNPSSHQRGCTEAALHAAAATGLITFASHTWSHPNLARLNSAEIEVELERPREWLNSRFANTAPLLAYPYGLRNDQVTRIARGVGYEHAFLIEGGWIRSSGAGPTFELPRLNVPAGISKRGFEIRTSGVL